MDSIECLSREVIKLSEQVKELTKIADAYSDSFNKHLAEETLFGEQLHECVAVLTKSSIANTEAIDLMRKSLEAQTEATSGMLEVYSTTVSLGKFAKWLSGLLASGVAIWAYFKLD